MSRPVWIAGLLLAALALPVQAGPAVPPTTPSPVSEPVYSIPAPVPTIQESTAVQTARSLFPASLVEAKPDASLRRSDLSGQMVWLVTWESKAGTIQVELDASDGQPLNANRWDGLPAVPGARMTQEQAAAKASEWLTRIAPGVKGALVPSKDPYEAYSDPSAFSFAYDFQVQGYPVPEARAYLRFTSETGELLSWHLDRPQGEMLMPQAILTESEAKAAFSKLRLSLQYKRAYWNDSPMGTKPPVADQTKMLLAYQPPLSYLLNQAGTWMDAKGEPIPDVGLPAWRQVPPPPFPYKVPTSPLSKEAALVLAKAASGQTREPDNFSADRGGDRLIYGFGWIDWSSKAAAETHVQVDAKAGLVQEFWSKQSEPPIGTTMVTRAEALTAAITFVQRFRPDLAANLFYPAVTPDEGPWGSFSFQFDRQHKGIPVDGYGLSVQVDGAGRVVQLWGGQEQLLSLPEPEGVLPPAPLMAKLVEVAGLELGWVASHEANGEAVYQLVWRLGTSTPVQLIEAQTGIFRDYDGTDVLRLRMPPLDVAGHWAEKEIGALFQQRIITVESGRFQPEKAMTQAEAQAWLARLSVGGPHPYLPAESGMVVGEPNSDSPITREAFARLVVVALGYDRIADMKNQIWMPFLDQAQIDPGARNAVAVLNGLGVIRGTPEGYFLPTRALTRAEAARILFQSLEYRRFGGYK